MDSSVQDLLNVRPEVLVSHAMDWSEYDQVIFNNLNASPFIKDAAFASVMNNLFTKMTERHWKVKKDVSILFGQNLRLSYVSQYSTHYRSSFQKPDNKGRLQFRLSVGTF